MRERLIALTRLRALPAAIHVLQKIFTLTIGPILVSAPLRRLRAGLDAKMPPSLPLRVAIVAHAYYPDLIPEILRCRSFLPSDTHVLITVPPDRLALAEDAAKGALGVTLMGAPNRGRDIAPFLAVLQSGAIDPYDVVLKLHTKRSPHLLDGETRRKLLFDALCGSRRGVAETLQAFLDPKVGMAGWSPSFRSSPSYWMANKSRIESLAARMGVAGPVKLGFFEGSMFWVRPAALTQLRQLSFRVDDFEPEAGQVDGTLHHAVERLFTVSAWASGFQVCSLQGHPLEGSVAPDSRRRRQGPT
jgi:rhamnosyltransferase